MITGFCAAIGLLVAGRALRPHHRRPLGFPRPAGRTWLPGRAARRTLRAAQRAYPDAIEMIVLAVRAGYLPAAAMEMAGPHLAPAIRPAFAAVATRMAVGERFADALTALPDALGPVAAPLAASFAAADRYGQPIAPVLERLATEARQHRRRHADALARQLPVRMSMPLVLCTLPSFILLAVVPLLLAALSSLHQ